jgi:hypothetical protein
MTDKGAIKVADEIWVATALLHTEREDQADFSVKDIVERALKENLGGGFRPGLFVHASTHAVANKPPNPGRYCMLYETTRGRRRLLRQGDVPHPYRQGGKILPEKKDVPAAYHYLIDWYDHVYSPSATGEH